MPPPSGAYHTAFAAQSHRPPTLIAAHIVFVSPVTFHASDVYSEIFTAGGEMTLVLKPLNEWEERLPQMHFARIHRSTIINIEFVERVEKSFNYSFEVYLRGEGEPFIMSRRYAARLKDRMK